MEMPPEEHECYETFTYPRFVDRGEDDWVDLIVQDLTETVGHSKKEKRLLHVMLEGPGDVKFMYDMAQDYLDTFYYPIQGKTSREGKRIDLPRVDESRNGWLALLQGSLQGALTYFKKENERSAGKLGTPTCTPQLFVTDIDTGEILYAAVIPALHSFKDHPPHGGDVHGGHENHNHENHNHEHHDHGNEGQ